MLDQETLLIKKAELILKDIKLVMELNEKEGHEPLVVVMHPDRILEVQRMVKDPSYKEAIEWIGINPRIEIHGLPIVFSGKMKPEATFVGCKRS